MKFHRLFLLATLPLALAACGPTAQQQADYLAVQRSGVSPAIYDKMIHDDALSVSDIEALSRARVNDAVILRYIRDEDTIYTLNSEDVIRMRRAGVSQSIIDYMLQSARNAYDYPGYGDPFYPGFYGYPGFWGPGFGFGYYGGFGYGGGYHHHHR